MQFAKYKSMCAMGEGGAFMDNAIITQDAIPIRKLCPECRKYFIASVKSNGEIVGEMFTLPRQVL